MSDLQSITGYRTNEDGTQTLAWLPRADGTVECVHEAPNCCVGCFEADQRLFRNYLGDVVAVLPSGEVRESRTIRRVAVTALDETLRVQRVIEAAAARAKREIEADIAAGVMPADVPDFSTLHNYVDANCYGGLCDDDCPPELDWSEGEDFEVAMERINAYQSLVDEWLRHGRPETHTVTFAFDVPAGTDPAYLESLKVEAFAQIDDDPEGITTSVREV